MNAPEPQLPRFGKYFVLGRIAQGGMAEVFKVKTVGLAGFEKIQVLKRILPAHSKNPRFIRSFIDEARIAVSLNHRNVVQVFDFGRFDDELFLTMELVEGINLRDAFQAAARGRERIPAPLACYILSEVAAGLDYAHRRRDGDGRPLAIVHCDVSPQNIALSWEGYVKILDFGVARASFAAAERGRLRGKPRYMAPEQTKGDLPTHQTDVFGLAVVAWEVFAGRPLFEGPDVESILKKIQRLEVPDVREHDPTVPEALALALAGAMQRHPPARGTAAELGAAFAQAQRELDPGTGSRQLARWLAERFADDPRYPRPPDPTGEVEADEAPATTPVRKVRAGSVDPVGRGSVTANFLRARAPTPAPGDVSMPDATATQPEPRLELSERSTSGSASLASASASHSLILEPDAEPELLDEKRRVVALTCLLAGGPAERRAEALRLLAGVAYKVGGLAQEDAGDGDESWLTVLFGLEVAGEDDVALAFRWSLAAADALREGGEAISPRIGIRQGIMARRRDPEGGPGRFQLLGDTWDEAAALAREAAPGRALYGGPLGRLSASGFALRELPPLKRRGRRTRVVELLGPRVPGGERGPRGLIVGRDAELAALREAWEGAIVRDERLVCAVVGEPGIGKTRLATEFALRLTGDGGEVVLDDRPVLWRLVSATPGGQGTPYATVVDLLHQEVGLPPGRGPAARSRLLDRLGRLAADSGIGEGDAAEIVAAVEEALELRDGAPSNERRAGSLRDRMLFALATFRERVSTAPRLTIIEDWHWLDAPSAEVLAAHLAQPVRGAELVLLTSRPSATGRDPATGPSSEPPPLPDAASPVIRIKELGIDEGAALLRARLGSRADDETIALVLRRSGGNPLFLEELASAVDDLHELPESARGVISARVDRLSRAAKAALQYAAVLGPILRSKVLEELLGKGAPRHIAALEQSGILSRIGKDAAEGDLVFRHGLLQEVVYDAIAGTARREAHRRVGLLLSEHYEAGKVKSPQVVARHLELGGDAARAALFYLRAGRLALAAFDPATAVASFGRALELGVASADREREALSGRAEARAQLGDHAGQRQDLEALGRLAAGDDRRLADVWLRTAALELRLGDLPAALAACGVAEKSAERAGDERLRGESLRLEAEAYEALAELDRALDAAGRALDIFRRIGHAAGETRALVAIGRIHLPCARFDAALAHYLPALDRVRGSGDPWLERIIRNNLGIIYLHRGEFREAMANARRALEICRRLGDQTREGDNAALVGAIALQLGLHDEAGEWLARGLAIHERTGSRWNRADALVYAGLREVLAGDGERGLAWLEEAIAVAEELGARYVLANAASQLAFALVRRRAPGDLARAERLAREAVEVARQARLPGCEVQALSRLALALFEGGDAQGALASSQAAVALLEEVRTIEWPEEEVWFTHHRVLAELGDPAAGDWLDRAFLGYRAKLERLKDPEWQAAFSENVPLHRQIRHEKMHGRRW